MKKTTLNGLDYDLVIDGFDIIAQGLTQDLVFVDGYENMKDCAEDEFDSYYGSSYPSALQKNKREFISEYIDENIAYWCEDNFKSAKVVVHNLN